MMMMMIYIYTHKLFDQQEEIMLFQVNHGFFIAPYDADLIESIVF